MSDLYFDDITTEFYNGTTWVDISADVVTDINGLDGFGSSDPDDRVAGVGNVSFSLNNAEKKYTPMGNDAYRGLTTLTGWERGSRLRISVSYGAVVGLVVFSGRVDAIDTDSGNVGSQRVHVVAYTYMEILTSHSMRGSDVLTNQTIDTGMDAILARIPTDLQPDAKDFDEGISLFPSIFTGVKYGTKASAEVNRLALSELGYVYTRKDGTLAIENRYHRKGTDPASETPLLDPGFLMNQGGYYIRKNDGDRILLSLAGNPDIAEAMEKLEIKLEDKVINSMSVKSYPTTLDSTPQILFKQTNPLEIASGVTLHFTGYYTDPNGGATQVSGISMLAPSGSYDYKMYTSPSGLGDITSYLTVSATYYSDRVDYTLTNTSNTKGFITLVQARGYGLYKYNPVETNYKNDASIDKYSESVVSLVQEYQPDSSSGLVFAKSTVEELKLSKSRLKSVNFTANVSEDNMMSFMYHDIGSKVELTEVRSGITNHYYIVSRKYSIKLGGIVTFSYLLQEANSILSGGIIPVKAQYGAPYYKLNYGYLPPVSNLDKMSISLWLKPYTTDNKLVSTKNSTSLGGFSFDLASGNRLQFYQRHGSNGTWKTATNTIGQSGTYNVVMTRDTSSNPIAQPLMYINGLSYSVTGTSIPSGTILDDSGLELSIGDGNYVGDLWDVRIYDEILTPSQVTELYNSGTHNSLLVTDNLVFQGTCKFYDQITSADLSGRNFGVDDDDNKAIENVYKSVGLPDYPFVTGTAWRYYPDSVADANANYSVAWSSPLGLFVAGGTNKIVLSSPDAKTWTSNSFTALDGAFPKGLVWIDELDLFIGGYSRAMLSSPDGTTWTSHALTTGSYNCAAYSPELGLAVAGSTQGYISTSTDGLTWTILNGFKTATQINGMVWVNTLGMFVGVCSSQTMIRSTDGINWTEFTVAIGTSWYGITWSPELGMLVAVGSAGGGGLETSTDGINWTYRTPSSAYSWKSIVWSAELGIFMAVAEDGTTSTAMYSFDGITWKTSTTPSSGILWQGVTWSPERHIFVAVASSGANHVMIK